ncbi:unnamed protein product [Clavelina lepadiformis]|uniref:Uncharacterized protein n=1 Tax=Clavelina lepadiformis TaxID=159417 RepID=A0ABP0FYD1_CLALP
MRRKCEVAQCEEAANVRYASCDHQVCIAHEDATFEDCVFCSAPQPLLEDPELLESSSSELSEHDEDDPTDLLLPGSDDDVANIVESDDVNEPNNRVVLGSFIELTEDLQNQEFEAFQEEGTSKDDAQHLFSESLQE